MLNKKKSIRNHKNNSKKIKTKPQDEKSEMLDLSDADEKDKNLLNFDLDESDDEENPETNNDENIHIPASMLEVASDEEEEDESEDEEDKPAEYTGKITLKIIKEWQNELMKPNPTAKFIQNAMSAFNAALNSISDDETKKSMYKIENPSTFNAAIQLCIVHLYPSMNRYLDINEKSNKNLQKSDKWRKVKNSLRHYFVNVAGLMERTTNAYMTTLLLKHLHQMSSFVSSFSIVSKSLLKTLINLWSTSQEDPVRVLSFLCILKITRSQQKILLNHVLKAMYISYIRNCKFVSPNTLAGINFMRRSLIELFLLDTKLAYQHAFLYIRQLAIHLRNAIILKKKQSYQAIYNWQYVNSIKFWAEMLGFSEEQPDLKPLVYPLVNLTIGLIKCTPTIQFYPLRFHCIKALIILSKQANVFIPILPFIFEILKGNLFKKSSTGESFKALDFTCILRVSKSQINDNNFKKEVIDQICSLTYEYLDHLSASIAYPDLIVPSVMLLRKFIKHNKDSNTNRKLKQLLDKIQENSKFIESERKSVNFNLSETAKINAWESTIRNKGTPLSLFYKNWSKTYLAKRKRQAANTSEISEFNIPVIKKKKLNEDVGDLNVNSDSDSDDFFGKESESEEENIVERNDKENSKNNKKTNKTKNKTKKIINKGKEKKAKPKVAKEKVNINDEVENLNIEDW
ncbi:nucleolar complex protein 2 homolog [Condylostylus longicornis]|uniref:nucleolar complex protein 2 homolog n=1 Tax=Condylostylus longicornis TaxID=2530218 RepID=UPI00244DB9E1|nr:nucleolar complex protein 2 homolog [Condylostylus longicornis]